MIVADVLLRLFSVDVDGALASPTINPSAPFAHTRKFPLSQILMVLGLSYEMVSLIPEWIDHGIARGPPTANSIERLFCLDGAFPFTGGRPRAR